MELHKNLKKSGVENNSLQRLIRSPGFIWVNGLSIGFLGALGLYARIFSKGVGFSLLFSDPFIGRPLYQGLFTNVSEVIWCVAFSICLFSFGMVRSLRPPRQADRFLLATAFLILFLLLDDIQRITLILHYEFGLPKILMLGFYGIIAIAYATVFRRYILQRTPYFLLIITIVFFVISSLADVATELFRIVNQLGPMAMLEDGSKMIGLLNLVLFCWKVGQQEIFEAIQQRPWPSKPVD